MDAKQEIRRMSCYAVLKMGYTGDNYLLAHMRLVLSLIYKKSYNPIIIRTMVNDFWDEYQYYIGFFPMKRILSLAVSNGYLKKSHNSKRYHYTKEIEEFSGVGQEIALNETKLGILSKEFREFAGIHGVTFSETESNDIITAYVNTQKLEHISGHISGNIKDKRIDYLFGSFVYQLKDANPGLFDYLSSLVIGSILADCLTFHEELDNTKQFDSLACILDTNVVFLALGIDAANRGEYYLNLVQSLKSKGSKVAMFEHSYNEMHNILIGASTWVESCDFDPSLSSSTTEYFRSINATKSDVEEYGYSLREKINELGIEIMSVDYEESNHKFQEDEKILYTMITDEYKQTNSYFSEEQTKRSIDLDVRSISFVYLLRKHEFPMQIQDSKYLFITTNRTIVKVAAKYHLNIGGVEQSIPTTLSDTFIGTYIWLCNPIQIAKMNENQIMAQAYLAFQPNKSMLSKLSHTVNKLVDSGTISAEMCYAIKGSKLVSDKLMQKTLGDPDEYTDSTPLEIISEIQNEAKKGGMEEERLLQEGIRNESERKFQELITQKDDLHIELLVKLLALAREKLDKQKSSQSALEKSKLKAEKTRTLWKVLISILTGVVILSSIYAIFIIWKYDARNHTIWNSLLSAILAWVPLMIGIIGTVYYSISSKSYKPAKWISFFLKKRVQSKFRKLECGENEFADIQNEIVETKQQIGDFENQLAKTQVDKSSNMYNQQSCLTSVYFIC